MWNITVSLGQGRMGLQAKSGPSYSQGREGLHRGGDGFQLPEGKESFK